MLNQQPLNATLASVCSTMLGTMYNNRQIDAVMMNSISAKFNSQIPQYANNIAHDVNHGRVVLTQDYVNSYVVRQINGIINELRQAQQPMSVFPQTPATTMSTFQQGALFPQATGPVYKGGSMPVKEEVKVEEQPVETPKENPWENIDAPIQPIGDVPNNVNIKLASKTITTNIDDVFKEFYLCTDPVTESKHGVLVGKTDRVFKSPRDAIEYIRPYIHQNTSTFPAVCVLEYKKVHKIDVPFTMYKPVYDFVIKTISSTNTDIVIRIAKIVDKISKLKNGANLCIGNLFIGAINRLLQNGACKIKEIPSLEIAIGDFDDLINFTNGMDNDPDIQKMMDNPKWIGWYTQILKAAIKEAFGESIIIPSYIKEIPKFFPFMTKEASDCLISVLEHVNQKTTSCKGRLDQFIKELGTMTLVETPSTVVYIEDDPFIDTLRTKGKSIISEAEANQRFIYPQIMVALGGEDNGMNAAAIDGCVPMYTEIIDNFDNKYLIVPSMELGYVISLVE